MKIFVEYLLSINDLILINLGENFLVFLNFVVLFLLFRTISWHLQNWQIREYRWDRMLAHWQTRSGFLGIFNLWFFPGKFPRPKLSGRIILTLLISCLLFIAWGIQDILIGEACYTMTIVNSDKFMCGLAFSLSPLPLWFLLLILERFCWAIIILAVFLSSFPVWISKQIIFRKARRIIKSNSGFKVIGITGSYGKSSTKEILVKFLQDKFSRENILFNPANFNNEIAIARLVIKNKKWFKEAKKGFFVVEIGAYRTGEIKDVCHFINPNFGIITGIGNQHLSPFGSQEKITKAKFELAEKCSEQVFFDEDNSFLRNIFKNKKIEGRTQGVNSKEISNLEISLEKSSFVFHGKAFDLFLSGEFWIKNTLLVISLARKIGLSLEDCQKSLKKIKPFTNSLQVFSRENFILIKDLYSINLNGALGALKHLTLSKGRKILISQPMLELGDSAEISHRKLFNYALKHNIEVWWLKNDFKILGKEILGKNFHCPKKTKQMEMVLQLKNELKKEDIILLEGRIDREIVGIFSV